MLIILEGCDGSGKTTLSNALIKKFPGLLVKITDRPKDASPKQRNKIKRHYISVIDAVKNLDSMDFVILDRFFPSEMVYSIKRGYDAMEDKDLLRIEEIISKMDHLLIFCNPGKDVIMERNRKQPDDYVTEEENLLMLGRYNMYFEKSKLNKLELDTNKPVEHLLTLIHKKVYEHPEHRKSRARQQRLPIFAP